ncbi:aldehyde dehydrogenase family protein [Candidatus Woesearchaeota archaeon]|nr:aldehyde dehydrogenase family protein [Candidatus Woesearchaeota archaeon]
MKSYKLYINGKWCNSSSGKMFKSFNPANGELLGSFQEGNERDVRESVAAAEKAYEKWSSYPAPIRAKILYKITELLKKNKEKLARTLTQEMGKVIIEARGDVQEAIDVFEYMAGEGRRLFGHTTPSELPDKFCMTVRRPIGVVGIITPWNFPFALPAWKLAPALICGNTVVFKPASETSLCAVELMKILIEAGVPKGVVNLVTGPGGSVGKEIVKNTKIRGVSFTGSKDVGKWVVSNAGVKRVGLELGGKNAIIVMDDANLKLAVDGIIWGAFGTTGQRCTATSRVIVHQKVKKQLEKELVARVKRLKLGDGLKKETDVGPLINKDAVEKSKEYVEIGKKEGARLICGGSAKSGKGNFFAPTVFTDVKKEMRIAQDEIFGPVLSLITFKSFEEAIKVANSVQYGLSSAIYTASIRQAFKAVEKIEAGITYINSSTIGSEVHLPFGGVKGTGNGTREAGIEGINEFSETKTIYIDYSDKLQRAQIDID